MADGKADHAVAERARTALDRLVSLRESDIAGAASEDLVKRWGGVYYDKSQDEYGVGAALSNLQAAAFKEFGGTNALYPATWPSVATMQAELIAFVVKLLGGVPGSACGMLASGGTESVLLAALAHREEAYARGVARPEIIASSTAHPAIHKAAFYFGMELKLVHPEPGTLRLRREDVEPLCSASTALIYASAPSFAHGVVDDVRGLAKLAASHGCGLHVDNCLGGILLQHMHRAGLLRKGGDAEAAAEALRLPGVTSVSVDLHKYGYCSKGVSAVVFHDAALRRRVVHPVVAVSGNAVSGGNYATPTLQGSRGGGPIAAAWATVRCMAGDGYLAAARRLHHAFETMHRGLAEVPGIEPVGDGELCILAFRSLAFPEQALAKAMRARGWNLSASENPRCLGICVGEQHCSAAGSFLADLRAAALECAAPAAGAGIEEGDREPAAAAGPYAAAEAGATEDKMRLRLLQSVERGLDECSGPPESKL